MRDRDAGAFFLIGSLSMIGIPIFAGFASKLFFALAAIEHGSQAKLILTMVVMAVSSMLTAVYFMRTLIRIYSIPGERLADSDRRAHHRAGYNVPMLVLTAINLMLGLWSWVFVGLIEQGLHMFV